MRDNADLFSEMPVRRAVLSLAVPTVISQVITVIYNMADTFFIGQLNDPNQVAAATIAMPAFVVLTALSNLFGIGGASKIARCLGRNDADTARRTAAFSIWTALAASLVYGVGVLLAGPWLLPLLGANAGTEAFASSYLFWTVTVGAAPTVLNAALAHLVRTEGYAREAGAACKRYAFEVLGRDKVYSIINADNLASIRVAESVGMTGEATFTARYFSGDMPHNLYSVAR